MNDVKQISISRVINYKLKPLAFNDWANWIVMIETAHGNSVNGVRKSAHFYFETLSKEIAERSGLSENQTGIFTEDVFWKKWWLSERIFQFFDRFGNMVLGR